MKAETLAADAKAAEAEKALADAKAETLAAEKAAEAEKALVDAKAETLAADEKAAEAEKAIEIMKGVAEACEKHDKLYTASVLNAMSTDLAAAILSTVLKTIRTGKKLEAQELRREEKRKQIEAHAVERQLERDTRDPIEVEQMQKEDCERHEQREKAWELEQKRMREFFVEAEKAYHANEKKEKDAQAALLKKRKDDQDKWNADNASYAKQESTIAFWTDKIRTTRCQSDAEEQRAFVTRHGLHYSPRNY